jgi:hypothetical protein
MIFFPWNACVSKSLFAVNKEKKRTRMFEAGLFESKIRIHYACVHLGGLQRRYLALTRSSIMLIVLGSTGGCCKLLSCLKFARLTIEESDVCQNCEWGMMETRIDPVTTKPSTTIHTCIYCRAKTFLLEGICISRDTCLSLGSFIPIQGEGPRGGVCRSFN